MRFVRYNLITIFVLISTTLMASDEQPSIAKRNSVQRQLLHNLSTQPYWIHHKAITVFFTESSQQKFLDFLHARINPFNGQTLQMFGDFYFQINLDDYHLNMFLDDGTQLMVQGTAVAHYTDNRFNEHTWYPIPVRTLTHNQPPAAARLLVAWRPPRPTEQFFKTIVAFVEAHPLASVHESFTGSFTHHGQSLNYQDHAEFLTFLYQPEAGYQVKLRGRDGTTLTLNHFDLELSSFDDTCMVNMQQHIQVPNHPPHQEDVSFACRIESKD